MRAANRNINEVLDAVAKHYEITREELVSGRRSFRRARLVALYFACCATWRSVPQIGASFGGVSNTNVLFAKRKIEHDMTRDAALAAEVGGIKLC